MHQMLNLFQKIKKKYLEILPFIKTAKTRVVGSFLMEDSEKFSLYMYTIAADVLETQGARASVVILLAEIFQIIPVSSPKALIAQQCNMKVNGK